MTPDQISLLTYLESQLFTEQGFFNENKLSPDDMKALTVWHEDGILEIKKLKLPDRTPNPIYTHKVRFSVPLYKIVWNARKQRAEQHSPTLKLSSDPEPTENPMFEDFQEFLRAHKAKMTPVQGDVAKELMLVLQKQKFQFFLSGKGTGKTWLFSTIDQFLNALRHRKKD